MALQTQTLAHFATKQIHLSQAYISALIAPLHPPLTPALLANLHTSFLNSSLQQSAAPQSYLPLNIATQHNAPLTGPTLVQVIHVQDIGKSRVAQLEALEKAIEEAGPEGRRVAELPAEEQEQEDGDRDRDEENDHGRLTVGGGKSICKLLLEDGRGTRVYGMETKPIEGVKVGMSLGCKLLLVNVPVLRGVLQLRPTNTTILGGRIEALDQGYFPARWKQEMEAELQQIRMHQNGE